MTNPSDHAALLVDGDNIPPALLGAAVRIVVGRVHVHPQHLPARANVTGFRMITNDGASRG